MTVLQALHSVKLALAPMAGITDKPFRQLARQFGADWAASEMIIDDPNLRHTRKTQNRLNHDGETGVVVVQIAGSDPKQLAQAAQYNVSLGAQVIDINMGCPAKKVCNVFSGSALLQNEPLVESILNEVVQAVDVPVTLKTRLGWDDEHKNIMTIAQMAELPAPVNFQAATKIVLEHIAAMHLFYGETAGVRIARKHISWYLANVPNSDTIRKQINQIDHASQQLDTLAVFLQQRGQQQEFWLRNYDETNFNVS